MYGVFALAKALVSERQNLTDTEKAFFCSHQYNVVGSLILHRPFTPHCCFLFNVKVMELEVLLDCKEIDTMNS